MHSLERIKSDNAEQIARRFLEVVEARDADQAWALLLAAPDLRAYIEKFRG